MTALVSGRAGLAVVLGDRPQYRPVHGSPHESGTVLEAVRLFAGFGDAVQLDETDPETVDRIAREMWALDRVLTLFQMMLDDSQSIEDATRWAKQALKAILTHRLQARLKTEAGGIVLPAELVDRAAAIAVAVTGLLRWIEIMVPADRRAAFKQQVAIAKHASATKPRVAIGGMVPAKPAEESRDLASVRKRLEEARKDRLKRIMARDAGASRANRAVRRIVAEVVAKFDARRSKDTRRSFFMRRQPLVIRQQVSGSVLRAAQAQIQHALQEAGLGDHASSVTLTMIRDAFAAGRASRSQFLTRVGKQERSVGRIQWRRTGA